MKFDLEGLLKEIDMDCCAGCFFWAGMLIAATLLIYNNCTDAGRKSQADYERWKEEHKYDNIGTEYEMYDYENDIDYDDYMMDRAP